MTDFCRQCRTTPCQCRRVVAKSVTKQHGMNKNEARYAEHLERRRLAGEVLAYWYEGVTLKLADDCRFTPDFMVQMADGTIEIHDTKACRKFNRPDGSLIRKGPLIEEDAAIKLRVAARHFPFAVKAMFHDGEWKEKEF